MALADPNRLWNWVERVGLAPALRRTYFVVQAAPRGWRYRARVGDVAATFETRTWYEFSRAKRLHGERHVLASLLADLDGADVVWDVGATVGTYACFAAAALTSGVVVGFEPVPENRERLRANLRANAPAARWRVSPYALWEADAAMELAFGHDPSRRAQPGAGHHYLSDEGWLTVDCRRGDGLVADGLPAPDLLKVDVQGAELPVLRGMGDALDGVRAVYVEIHREKCTRYGDTADAVEAFLRDAGFDLTELGGPTTYRHGVYHVAGRRPEEGADGPADGTSADAPTTHGE